MKSVPGLTTRPTADRVKEAIFSMIGPYFAGGVALDLFAGTGALGIEALSRGVERAIFVDLNPKSVEVIRENLKRTNLSDRAEVYRNDASKALKALSRRGLKLSLIFLDPPYREEWAMKAFQQLEDYALCESGATVVLEHPVSRMVEERAGSFLLKRHAQYGETAVSIFEYTADSSGKANTKGDLTIQ